MIVRIRDIQTGCSTTQLLEQIEKYKPESVVNRILDSEVVREGNYTFCLVN